MKEYLDILKFIQMTVSTIGLIVLVIAALLFLFKELKNLNNGK